MFLSRKFRWSKLLYICLLLLRLYNLHAQDAPIIIPPSPNASSLGKYGEFPISLYTGTPSINIPIVELQSRTLKLPISLSYHATGIKVEEMASWVGLGWSLNAGGVITRSVRGKPDEDPIFGSFTANNNYDLPSNISEANYKDLMKNTDTNIYDSGSDIYFYNFLGYSGQFYLKKQNNGTLKTQHISKKDIIIIPPQNLNSEEWKIITKSGITILFGGVGYTELTNSLIYGASMHSEEFTSSWYIKSITSSDGKDKITFSYTTETISYGLKISETDYQLSSTDSNHFIKPNQKTNAQQQILSLSPSEIYMNDQLAIRFQRSVREDLLLENGSLASKLESIQIYNYINDGELIKSYTLEHGYFEKKGFCEPLLIDNSPMHRLKLERIRESKTKKKQSKIYAFEYYRGLPNRCSLSQDYWGYYNGAPNNTLLTLSPGFENQNYANREPHPEYMKAGTLKKIIFPNGCNTEFYFEAHNKIKTKLLLKTQSMNYNSKKTYVGGLRISKIATLDEHANLIKVKNFSYNKFNETSPVDNIIYSAKYHNNNSFGYQDNLDSTNQCTYNVRAVQSEGILGSTQGRIIEYEKVTSRVNSLKVISSLGKKKIINSKIILEDNSSLPKCINLNQSLNIKLDDSDISLKNANITWYKDDIIYSENSKEGNSDICISFSNSGKHTIKAQVYKPGYLEIIYEKQIIVSPKITIKLKSIEKPFSYDIDLKEVFEISYIIDGTKSSHLPEDLRLSSNWEVWYGGLSKWEKFDGQLIPGYDQVQFRYKLISEYGNTYMSNTIDLGEDKILK